VWKTAIQEGRIYRSSQFYSPQMVKEKGIRSILDLRRLQDCCKKQDTSVSVPSRCKVCSKQWQSNGVAHPKVFHVDLINMTLKMYIIAKMPCKIWWEVAKTVYKGRDPATVMCPAIANNSICGFKWFYSTILDKSKDNIARALRVFADPCSYPILVHCIHGKDRTGLIVMLLLRLCGVPKEPIMTDYAESDHQLKKGKANDQLQMADYLKQDSVIAAMPGDCEAALNHIEEKYGTVVDYLLSCGLSEEELQRIRVNMLIEDVLIQIPRGEYAASAPGSTRDSDQDSLPSISSADNLAEIQSIEKDLSAIPLLRQSSSVPNLLLESSAPLGD